MKDCEILPFVCRFGDARAVKSKQNAVQVSKSDCRASGPRVVSIAVRDVAATGPSPLTLPKSPLSQEPEPGAPTVDRCHDSHTP